MKLRYFMAPHDLLDEATGKLMPCTLETIAEKDLGLWVTIGLEKSEVPRLLPLISVVGTNKQGQPMDMLSSGANGLVLKVSTNRCKSQFNKHENC